VLTAKKQQATKFLIVFLLIISFGLSACSTQSSPTPISTSSSAPENTTFPTETPLLPTPTSRPEVAMTVNGAPYSFSNPLQIIDSSLWLPSVELFNFIEREEVSLNDGFISTAGNNSNGKYSNCHFWIGKTGENTYSPDTEGDIWFSSDLPPFSYNGEVYLSEKMIEDCVGEFIQFDEENNSVSLTLGNKILSAMQENNPNSVTFYKLKKASELNDSRIGNLVSGMVKTPATVWLDDVPRMKIYGFTRARSTLNATDGLSIEPSLGNIEEHTPQDYIEIYKSMKDAGIITRYSLSFWDLENRQNGGSISKQRLSSEDEIERYLDYVRMVVTDLKGLVAEYELWNEPDANVDMYQRIEPEDYIAVAKRAIPIIREIDPQAKIVLAATSSYVDLPCQKYTRKILESDILPMGDILSLHTVNNDASPVFLSDYYYGYDSMWQDIKSLAEEHGFTGEYYADELNYRSEYSLTVLGPEEGNYHPYEPEIAAKYFARMIAINEGMDISVGTSGTNEIGRPIEGKMIQNMAYLLDGLKAFPFEVQATSQAELIREYTFSDEAGNLYVFIWNDGAANVESQDVTASILIPGKSADQVTAFDPYLMNEQSLVFENTDLGLQMDRVLLRDYPLLYKIELD
jgi:hypothetical protein